MNRLEETCMKSIVKILLFPIYLFAAAIKIAK